MPFTESPNLTEPIWEFCYERSIGNISTLIDWLAVAYDLSLSENAITLSFEHLKDTAKSRQDCEQMIEEAIRGEVRHEENEEPANRLQVLLGMKQTPPQPNSNNQSNSNSTPHKKQQPGRKNQPFKRKAKRDAVGG